MKSHRLLLYKVGLSSSFNVPNSHSNSTNIPNLDNIASWTFPEHMTRLLFTASHLFMMPTSTFETTTAFPLWKRSWSLWYCNTVSQIFSESHLFIAISTLKRELSLWRKTWSQLLGAVTVPSRSTVGELSRPFGSVRGTDSILTNSAFSRTPRSHPQSWKNMRLLLRHFLMLSNFTGWIISSVSVVCLDMNPRECSSAPRAKWISCLQATRFVQLRMSLPWYITSLIQTGPCWTSSNRNWHNVVFRWSATIPHVSMCLYERRQYIEPEPQSYWPALKHARGSNSTGEYNPLATGFFCTHYELGRLLCCWKPMRWHICAVTPYVSLIINFSFLFHSITLLLIAPVLST